MRFAIASSDQAADFEQIVTPADEALLQAKAAGRNRIVAADADVDAPTPPADALDDRKDRRIFPPLNSNG